MAGKNTYKKRITPGVYFEDNNLNDLGKGVNNNKYNATRKLIEEGYLVDEFFGDILLSEDNKILERETLIETIETTVPVTTTSTTMAPVTTTSTTMAPVTTTTTTAPIVKEISNGRLYNWYAMTDSRGITPIGWHIPTVNDVLELINSNAYNQINLFKIGVYYSDVPRFSQMGTYGRYATSDLNSNNMWMQTFQVSSNWGEVIHTNSNDQKFDGYAIRLLKDNSVDEGPIIIDGDTYNTVKIGDQVWLQQNLAATHYQNGDLIGSDFSGIEGAVTAYNNDETNVYYQQVT